MRRDLDVTGPQDPDEVWDCYVRPARWSQWSPQIRAVEYPAERLVAGAAGVVRGPVGLAVPFTVTDVDERGPERSWSWRVSAAGVRLDLEHTVRPRADGVPGAATHLTVTGPAPVVLAYLPAAWWALHRLVH